MGRHRHRVGADDLGHLGAGELVQRAVGEQAVRACDGDRTHPLLGQPVKQLEYGGTAGDLVVEDDHVPPGHVADDRRDDHLLVVDPLLGPGRDRHAEPAGERGRALGVAEVGRDHHGIGQVAAAEVGGELPQRVQVVHRHREEAVHLRRVQGQREHPVDTRGDEQVGDQPAADGDAWLVLLVRPRVDVVRHHRGHPRRRGAPGRVRHQQQLDQVLLHRRRQRLDEEHVPLPAVGLELDLQAVVREPGQPHRPLRHVKERADLGGQRRVGAAAENRDLTHRTVPGRGCAPGPAFAAGGRAAA